jgi:hypothetical protein
MLANMVLLNPNKAFKFDRDKHVQSLLKRGVHHVKDMKNNKSVLDSESETDTHYTIKNPVKRYISNAMQENELSLMNLTVKQLNQSFHST